MNNYGNLIDNKYMAVKYGNALSRTLSSEICKNTFTG
jgi:hypothetical protein